MKDVRLLWPIPQNVSFDPVAAASQQVLRPALLIPANFVDRIGGKYRIRESARGNALRIREILSVPILWLGSMAHHQIGGSGGRKVYLF
jgi:hypothetical protein